MGNFYEISLAEELDYENFYHFKHTPSTLIPQDPTMFTSMEQSILHQQQTEKVAERGLWKKFPTESVKGFNEKKLMV